MQNDPNEGYPRSSALACAPSHLACPGCRHPVPGGLPKAGAVLAQHGACAPPTHPPGGSGRDQRGLPGDPAQIEAWVIEHIRRDANDYANWGGFFYIASPEEVLSIGRGPCYGRAVVLASILEDKHIPYRVFMMPGHVWVDYADRVPTVWPEFEKSEYAIWRWENGRWRYHGFGWLRILPRMFVIQMQLYWRIMPGMGKIVILMVILMCIGLVWSAKKQ